MIKNSMRRFAAGVVALCTLASTAVMADEISVTQWGARLTGLPYIVAMEKGFFLKAGANVTGVIGSGGGGSTVRNILASPLPYGEVSLDAAVSAKQHGLDIIIVNIGTRRLPGSSVVTLEPTIKSLKDLAGKRAAITTPRSVSEMAFVLGLKQAGVTVGDVTRVSAGGYAQGLTMLDHGAVDAASLIEPLSLYQKGKYREVTSLMNTLPPMVITVGITTRSFAKSNPQVIRAIIASREAAVKAVYADPKAALASLASSPAYKIPPAIAAETLQHMIAARTLSEGAFNQAELDRTLEGLRLVGAVEGDVDWNALIDKSYLPADLKGE
jgi:NitT/TauT family transport system substrate-binding protein